MVDPRSDAPEPDPGHLLATAMQHALGSVVITDVSGRIVYVNPAFERVTGYTAAEVMGKCPSVLSSGMHTRAFYRQMWGTLARGEPWRGELINRRKSGELYDAELSIAPVRDASGAVTHFLGTHRELTAEKQARRLLEDKVRELDLLNRELDDFVSRVSSDLREPLRGIEAICAATARELGHLSVDALAERAGQVGQLAGKLKKRVQGLERLSRVGKDRRVFTKVDLGQLLGEVQQELFFAARQRRVTLRIGELPAVMGNRLLVGEMLASLVSNAIRLAGEPPIVVIEEETGADVPPGFVRIAVRDNGAGVAERDRDRIFAPFYRGRGAAENGLGTGLALVRKVAERHGGRVWVDDALEGGAAFHVLLPAAGHRRTHGDETTAARFHTIAPPVESDDAPPSPPARVLLVEADPVAAELVADALRAGSDSAPKLETVRTAAEAISHALQGEFDVVLVDMDLPGGDGLALLGQLHHDHPALPLVAIAGDGDERLAVQAMQRGAVDYVTHDEVSALLSRAAAAVVERTRAARVLEQTKSDLVGIVTHDLKNPVANVVGYVDLLLDADQPLSDRQRNLLSRIKDNAMFMLELIADILDAARIDAGKLRLVPARGDLVDLVRDALSRSEFLAGDKGIALVGDLPDHPIMLTYDRGKIMQVLNNLISNALKYSATGTTVRVALGLVGETVEVSVIDQGQGIRPEEIAQLFKKFSRTSARATRGEKSTGLGLYIVNEMLKLHHGSIRVHSEPGKGSTFTFTLPLPSNGQSR